MAGPFILASDVNVPAAADTGLRAGAFKIYAKVSDKFQKFNLVREIDRLNGVLRDSSKTPSEKVSEVLASLHRNNAVGPIGEGGEQPIPGDVAKQLLTELENGAKLKDELNAGKVPQIVVVFRDP